MCQELWIYYYDHLNFMRKVYQMGKQSQTIKKLAQTLTPMRGQRCYFKIYVCSVQSLSHVRLFATP